MRPTSKTHAERKSAHAWWAQAAYGGRDRSAALDALKSSGVPLGAVDRSPGILSAMARGESLIKGAADLAVPRRKGGGASSRYLRLLQWRLVMAYAGFEIFAKACLGKSGSGGLHPEDIDHLATCSGFTPGIIDAPRVTAATAKWLEKPSKGAPMEIVSEFLQLKAGHGDFLHEWFRGKPIATAGDACHLAKIIRHATAHGVLSPTKCHGLGLVDAIRGMPKTIDGIRQGVIVRIYESRPGA